MSCGKSVTRQGRRKENCRILSQDCIGENIYSLWLEGEDIANAAVPGQFLSLYSRDKSRLLPRPISICEIDREGGRLRLVYRVTGKNTGTEEFSRLCPGDIRQVLGPLGNGFPLEAAKGRHMLLIGGGIGIPPMLETAKQLKGEKTMILGYRDQLFLQEEFSSLGRIYLATEDGSAGTKGNVLNVLEEKHLSGGGIFACGPAPMLRAVSAWAAGAGIPCWISMEERMACGVGACLACVCGSVEEDTHSHVKNKRICRDGPVFLSTEVEI
ncbi:MAG: dihydroorotate dehydrogenase electron transfer subunit [Clostridiales bacterium]|nr:dihydroorotate dehydrogenase electron transfer subunit [Clostridiales bacterium]